MKDGSVAVKIDFPGSDLAGAIIFLEDWQARGAESPGGQT